jgi:hypothetical protein
MLIYRFNVKLSAYYAFLRTNGRWIAASGRHLWQSTPLVRFDTRVWKNLCVSVLSLIKLIWFGYKIITYKGAFVYAEDIIILCPSKFSLRTQLHVASSYSVEYLVLFNATKCHLLYASANRVGGDAPPAIVFQGTRIAGQGTAMHLGHLIGPDAMNADVISVRIQQKGKRSII